MRFVRALSDTPKSVDEDAIRACLADYPVSLAVLFGSGAHGDLTPRSDLDIAVEFELDVPDERRLELLDALTADLVRSTGFEAVDLVDLDDASPALGYDILSRGVLLVGDEATVADFQSRFLVKKLDFQHFLENVFEA
jgi:predicted nucleotidyltransferase